MIYKSCLSVAARTTVKADLFLRHTVHAARSFKESQLRNHNLQERTDEGHYIHRVGQFTLLLLFR